MTDGRAALDAARARPARPGHQRRDDAGLDGLGLVAALRADPRTADLPVLLLSARAGEEAAIEGLDAGADDYLVKPFSAAELLARVRASVQLSRMRGQHARWRAALIESLHEAFFLCGPDGAVLEINSAFTDMLGYGPEGLPYRAPHPVVAGSRVRSRRVPDGRAALPGQQGAARRQLHRPRYAPRRPPAVGGGQLRRGA